MKKWENPQLSVLGIEKTNQQFCMCGATKDKTEKNQHYCHYDEKWHQNNCSSLKEGHQQNDPCSGDHEWAGEAHKSKCCCGTFTGGNTTGETPGETPGLS